MVPRSFRNRENGVRFSVGALDAGEKLVQAEALLQLLQATFRELTSLYPQTASLRLSVSKKGAVSMKASNFKTAKSTRGAS